MLWFLLACPHPAPPVDAPAAEAPSAQGATTLTLSSHGFSAPSFTEAELVDLHLTRAPEASVVRNAVSGAAHCEGDHCWLDLVHPNEVIELRSSTAADVVVTPFPPPEPTPIAPGDTVTVEPAPLAHEDALPAADLVFSLDAPATVVLHVRPLHDGPDHTGKHLTDVAIFGGWGREQASVLGQVLDEPGVHKNTWTLAAGEWRVRVRGEAPADRAMYCFSDPEFGLAPPAWCAEETDPLPYPIEVAFVSAEPVALEPANAGVGGWKPARHTLTNSPHTFPVGAEPEPETVSVEVVPGNDVILTWQPEDAFVAWHWAFEGGESWGGCFEWPCVLDTVPYSTLDLSIANEDAAREVEVSVLSLPPPRPVELLEPGYEAALPLEPIAPSDPRGPLTDLLLRIDTPGDYVVSAEFDPTLGQPRIEMLENGSSWSPSMWNLLGTEEGWTGQRFELHEAGDYVVRFASGVDSQPQVLDVHFYAAEPIKMPKPPASE